MVVNICVSRDGKVRAWQDGLYDVLRFERNYRLINERMKKRRDELMDSLIKGK